MTQGVDLRHREAQSDGKQQEDDAEFCQRANRLRFDDRSRRVRTEQNPDKQVAETRRDVQPVEGDHNDYGRSKQQERLRKKLFNHAKLSETLMPHWIGIDVASRAGGCHLLRPDARALHNFFGTRFTLIVGGYFESQPFQPQLFCSVRQDR
jgi:hypothetical protein